MLLLLTAPYTPCCPLHTHQHMLCSVAIVDSTMYTMLSTTHINTCYVVLLWLPVPCTPCCPLHTHQHMLCSVAIVDFYNYWWRGVATTIIGGGVLLLQLLGEGCFYYNYWGRGVFVSQLECFSRCMYTNNKKIQKNGLSIFLSISTENTLSPIPSTPQ